MARGPLITEEKKTKMAEYERGGWTRSAIAKELGVSNSAVTRYLGAKVRTSLDVVCAMDCKASVETITKE